MTNLQKLGKLYQYFALCDWNHNSNKGLIEANDNGFSLEIEFDIFNEKYLKIADTFRHRQFYQNVESDENIEIRIDYDTESGTLHGFTWNFEMLDDMLTIIFRDFVLTDMETIEMDSKKLITP